MRILHTSDWHLGRNLHEAPLHDAHGVFLRWLVDQAESQAVDAIIVAGDVFDRGVPPAESMTLLTSALVRLTELAPVLMLSGNHDSYQRLGFGSPLFRDRLRIVTTFPDALVPMVIPHADGDVVMFGLPYVDPDRYRTWLAGNDVPEDERPGRNHDACVRHLMDQVRQRFADLCATAESQGRPRPRSVVSSHAFVVGEGDARTQAIVSESERPIQVGGLDTVGSSAYSGVDYVALGHLHGAQQPKSPPDVEGRRTVLRYSGSPLRFSFSEEFQEKSITVVSLDRLGVSDTTVIPVPQPRGMVSIEGILDDLVSDIHAGHRESWVRARVTDQVRPDNLHQRLKAVFPHLLQCTHEPHDRVRATLGPTRVAKDDDPVEVTAAFVAYVTGRYPREAELLAAREAVEAVRRDRQEAGA